MRAGGVATALQGENHGMKAGHRDGHGEVVLLSGMVRRDNK
jgi:hypothetical protein